MQAHELAAFMQRQSSEQESLVQFWKSLIPTYCPSTSQWSYWQSRYSFDLIYQAVIETGEKFLKLNGNMSATHLGKFCSCVLRERDAERAKESLLTQ